MRGAEQLTNVDDLLRRQALAHPGSTALVEGDRRLSWQELDRHVEALARGLAELGLVAGHRVALASANRVELVAGYLAVLRGGLVAVPVDPTSTAGELRRVLAESGARVCLADASAAAAAREAVRTGGLAVRLVLVGEPPDRSADSAAEMGYDDLPAEGPRIVAPRDPEALAVLAATSGTSGRPRAAMLSHRALLANIEQCAALTPTPVEHGDVVLGLLPMWRVYGLNAVLGQVLLTGASLVLSDRSDADEALRLVRREQVTCLPLAPSTITDWLDRPDLAAELSTVRLLVSGAAHLPADVALAFHERTGIAVHQGYGLAEASPVVTSTLGSATRANATPRATSTGTATPEGGPDAATPDTATTDSVTPASTPPAAAASPSVAFPKPGSSGQALPGVELRIVDETGTDVIGAGSDPGEVWVRGPNLFSGYWPDGDEDPGPGGWLRTGDIGFLDPDGDLFIVDRLEEVVVVSGFTVYPSEVEDVVNEVEGVAECAVIGASDAETGQTVVAYVVAAPTSARSEASALRSAVLRHCGERLARFKVPTRVEILDALPHAQTGDVAKGRLRARHSEPEVGP